MTFNNCFAGVHLEAAKVSHAANIGRHFYDKVLKVLEEPLGKPNMERRVKISAHIF